VLRGRSHRLRAVLAAERAGREVRSGGTDAGAVKAGDRVKTDRRDAAKLAGSYRSGDLTAVWVPDAAHEALRDLVRARLAAKADQLRARHRLIKFLLRHGRRAPEGTSAWTEKYLQWVKSAVHFEPTAQEVTLSDYLHGGRACRRARYTSGALDRGGDREPAGEDARGDRSSAEPARDRTHQRRDDHGRAWGALAL
jgi:transposase